MADNSILTPGYQDNVQDPEVPIKEETYLLVDNYLSEYSSDELKSVVRENLNIYPKDSVYTKVETDTEISKKLKNVLLDHLNTEDPHGILPQVDSKISNMVKNDGSTPFKNVQKGVDPQTELDLVTKRYADLLIKNHLGDKDPHSILPEVLALLLKYALLSDIYKKSEVYTKKEVDDSLKLYIKRDGTTPFTKAQVGIDPTIDSHLATKRYVDKSLYLHLVDVDPHGFITILNLRLAYYAKSKDVYDKTLTYSRTLIDSQLNKLVNDSLESQLLHYQDAVNESIDNLVKANFVKQDGSIPFINPQSGVEAIEEYQLTTLGLVNKLLENAKTYLSQQQCVWKTSGPVLTTVGFVEDNSELPEELTMQEILDAIFYGASLSINVEPHVPIGETTEVTVCIRGSVMIDHAELYQNDKLIYTFTSEDFEEGCVTVTSDPIYEDTEFTFKVYYTNDTSSEVSATVTCTSPVFIGLLPKWKYANTITMDYLKELEAQDVEGTLNRFVNISLDTSSYTFRYLFEDVELRHPFIVIPESYPDLDFMSTKSQSFGIEAFDIINMIPLEVAGQSIIYKIYVYRQALSNLNLDVTFNFVNE